MRITVPNVEICVFARSAILNKLWCVLCPMYELFITVLQNMARWCEDTHVITVIKSANLTKQIGHGE